MSVATAVKKNTKQEAPQQPTSVVLREAQTEVLAPAPAPVLAPAPAREAQPAEHGTGGPALVKALAQARDRCGKAHKSATNTFHKYKYASADQIISVASDALEGSGLAVIPVSEEMHVTGAGSAAFYSLRRVLALVHESGQSVGLTVENWPVVPDRGRPLDKAYTAALSSSLAYKLRDLLQMPRVDPEDDVAGRDDSAAEPAPPPRASNVPAKAPPQAAPQAQVGNRILDRVMGFQSRLIDAGLCGDGELLDWLEDQCGQAWVKAPADEVESACQEFKRKCQAATATPAAAE